MFRFSGKTNFLAKLSFVSTLSCKAMEINNINIINNSNSNNNSNNSSNNSDIIINSDFNNINEQETKYEKQFCEVLGKKYNKKNGNLELLTKASGIQCIESNKTLEFIINNESYYIYIDKNQSNKFLDIFDNTGITSLTLFTAEEPIPSLINCNNLTKIQLSFDNDEDIKYLNNVLNVVKTVKNLNKLDLRYLYYYCLSGYKNDILVIIDNVITSLKLKFPNLEYIYPNIYEKSKDYKFIDFKNKKEILDIVTLDCKNLFSNYTSEIGNNIATLDKYIDIVSKHFNDLDNDLKENEKDLYDINLLENKIKSYKDKLTYSKENKLSDNDIIIIKENIKTLSNILSVKNQNGAKTYLKNKISELEKDKNIIYKYKFNFIKSKLALKINNSLIDHNIKNIEEKKYNKIKNIYKFISKFKQKLDICPKLEFIDYLGNECIICLDNIMIKDIIKDNIMKTQCNHIFHKKCLNTWRIENNTCPTCRGQI